MEHITQVHESEQGEGLRFTVESGIILVTSNAQAVAHALQDMGSEKARIVSFHEGKRKRMSASRSRHEPIVENGTGATATRASRIIDPVSHRAVELSTHERRHSRHADMVDAGRGAPPEHLQGARTGKKKMRMQLEAIRRGEKGEKEYEIGERAGDDS